jgi:hypothetical protein
MKSLRVSSIFGSGLLASALAIGMVASAPMALAQHGDSATKADIPFDFQAGQKVMPAGTYEISKAGDHMLLLRAKGQQAAEFLTVHDAYALTAPTGSSLVFDRRGNSYFLRQIWTAGEHNGLECRKPRVERKIEAEYKQAESPVVVAMNTPR